MAVVIKYIVIPILGDGVLEHAKTVAVDRLDIHGTESTQEILFLDLLDPLVDALLEFTGRPLSEGEGDD